MNNTCTAAINAAKNKQSVTISNVRTIANGRRVKVFLHEKECMELDFSSGKMTINGDTLPTRKSCRLINAFLSAFGDGRMMTRSGSWFYEYPEGDRVSVAKDRTYVTWIKP